MRLKFEGATFAGLAQGQADDERTAKASTQGPVAQLCAGPGESCFVINVGSFHSFVLTRQSDAASTSDNTEAPIQKAIAALKS